MFVLYGDSERANCIRYDYECNYWYIDEARCPQDNDFTAFTNLHIAMKAYKAFIANELQRNNTEFCVFLQAEAYEDGELVDDMLIACYACYKKNGRNIVLNGINAKQKREEF